MNQYVNTLKDNWILVGLCTCLCLCLPIDLVFEHWQAYDTDYEYVIRFALNRLLFHVMLVDHWTTSLFWPIMVSYYCHFMHFMPQQGKKSRSYSQRWEYFFSRWPTFMGYGCIPAMLYSTPLFVPSIFVCSLYHNDKSKTKYGIKIPQGPTHKVDYTDYL